MATAKKPNVTATIETKKAAPRRKPATASAQKAPAAATSRASKAAPNADPTHEVEPREVERLAYQLWEQRGRPEGTSVEDWNRAKEILLQTR